MKDFGDQIMKTLLSITIFFLILCCSAFAQTNNQNCPNIEIISPTSAVQEGETISFSASFGGDVHNYDVKYKWTIDKGTLIDGQYTNFIQVATDGLNGEIITATFEIEGLPSHCKNKFSDVAVVAERISCGFSLDEYDKIPLSEELARLDNFLISLQEDSDSKGFVWMTIDQNESVENAKKHIKRLVQHIKYRKAKKEKITFAIEKSDQRRTRLMIIPDDAEFPNCEKCEMIKGSDIE
jgi:hypothetical protein